MNHADARVESLSLEGATCQKNYSGNFIYVDTAGGMVSNCVIRNGIQSGSITTLQKSSPVYLASSAALLTHCVITNNRCTVTSTDIAWGQVTVGVHADGKARIEHCLIADNHDVGDRVRLTNQGVWGAGITGSAFVRGCTVVNNTGFLVGGISLSAGGVTNCIVAGNVSRRLSKDNANFRRGTAYDKLVRWTLTDDAEVIATSCCIQNAETIFRDYAAKDYRPAPGSLAVDGGRGGYAEPSSDLGGGARVLGTGIDLGCYEYVSGGFDAAFRTETPKCLVPSDLVFTASCTGTNASAVLSYRWDFNGDGAVDRVTDAPVVTNRYTAAGTVSVALTVADETSGRTIAIIRPDYLYLVPRTMHFADNVDAADRSTNMKFPCAVWAVNGKLANCTIVRNTGFDVGGIMQSAGSTVNSVVAGNVANAEAGVADAPAATQGYFSSCIVGGELASLFANPSRCRWAPRVGSALVDSGTLAGLTPPSLDLAGNPRVVRRTIDIGCYECQSGARTLLILQ